MNRLIKAIKAGRFVWQNYLGGKKWHGIMLQTCPLFSSYGQIGYSVDVYDRDRHTLTITHDWELCKTEVEHF